MRMQQQQGYEQEQEQRYEQDMHMSWFCTATSTTRVALPPAALSSDAWLAQPQSTMCMNTHHSTNGLQEGHTHLDAHGVDFQGQGRIALPNSCTAAAAAAGKSGF